MAEYIDRDTAIVKAVHCIDNFDPLAHDIAKAIDAIPSADVIERKCGKWIIDEEYVSTSQTRGRETHVITWACSNCLRSNGRRRTNFCPNCGADMRESEEEE